MLLTWSGAEASSHTNLCLCVPFLLDGEFYADNLRRAGVLPGRAVKLRNRNRQQSGKHGFLL